MPIDQQSTSVQNAHQATPSGHTAPIIQLLNQGDQLTQQFQKQFNDSISHVQTLSASVQQHENLTKLAHSSSLADITPQRSSVRQRTLATLEKTSEEAMAQIRNSLENMETTVEQLSELLYKVDIYLSEPKHDGSIGFNPLNALNHLSNLFSVYQAELLEKRELFSSFNCEEIDVNSFLQRWKICNQINALTQDTMQDLADVMGAWST
ncbi:hypothetical protein O181_080379 [Austropuccinia psidii MF-1]|uniref:Uncharacterized protein n=1 Tax=Austropuccinia psidii MF-1 TaxID=1389203 RepID=A0A9Q3FKS7_9BASI|nr:hypothetical protein [Austropuccinia psidii MF-1]